MTIPMPSLYTELAAAIQADQLIASITVLRGPGQGRRRLVWPDGRSRGSLGDPQIDDLATTHARNALARQQSERLVVEEPPAGESTPLDLFIDVHVPPPKLVIVGAVHIAIPLVTFAKTLGLRTVVVDARTVFASQERFGHADALMIGWPADILPELNLNESTYVVTLTHDEKLDNPALVVALNHPVRYIGALGSKRTHAKRVEALKAEGVSAAQLARIHAPIGLDLGGRSPAEIALAIMAEIVTVMNSSL